MNDDEQNSGAAGGSQGGVPVQQPPKVTFAVAKELTDRLMRTDNPEAINALNILMAGGTPNPETVGKLLRSLGHIVPEAQAEPVPENRVVETDAKVVELAPDANKDRMPLPRAIGVVVTRLQKAMRANLPPEVSIMLIIGPKEVMAMPASPEKDDKGNEFLKTWEDYRQVVRGRDTGDALNEIITSVGVATNVIDVDEGDDDEDDED